MMKDKEERKELLFYSIMITTAEEATRGTASQFGNFEKRLSICLKKFIGRISISSS